ncbi:MAG: thioredoxin, partial [Nitrososphaera sp.]
TEIFCEHFGVTEGGNFEGRNILNIRVPVNSLAQRYGKTPEQIEQTITHASAKLFAEREKRVRPGRDEKILASWNGLMISGFVKGFAATGEEKYLDAAKKAVRFVETRLASSDSRLYRTFKDGQAKLNAYLDDYAFYVGALLDLFAIDSKAEYLERAIRYNDYMLGHFWDSKDGDLFFTSDDHEKLIVRTKNFYDLAIPSGTSVAANNLLR